MFFEAFIYIFVKYKENTVNNIVNLSAHTSYLLFIYIYIYIE